MFLQMLGPQLFRQFLRESLFKFFFFALFPERKSCEGRRALESGAGAHSSSSTLSAHQTAPGTSGSHVEPIVVRR